jgi:hypothetical protein
VIYSAALYPMLEVTSQYLPIFLQASMSGRSHLLLDAQCV